MLIQNSKVCPPIADLHCDLLLYLSLDRKRTPYDPPVRCSIPQLRQGNVKIQTMAIYTETVEGSVKSGISQVEAFLNLLKNHSDVFERIQENSNKIGIIPAIENASAFL